MGNNIKWRAGWATAKNQLTKRLMYSVVVAQKAGVICKSCGEAIEIEDDYIPGIRGTAMAASLYKPFLPAGGRTVDFVNRAWQKTLICGNPDCGKTHEYRGDDLLLYDD